MSKNALFFHDQDFDIIAANSSGAIAGTGDFL
jgi:hypothetical protein